MTTDDKIAKLPLWARGVIQEQQNEIDRLTRELRFAQGDPGETAWAFRTHWNRPDVPVAEKYDSLEVHLVGYDEGINRERKIQLRLSDHGLLEVRGGRALSFHPQASNALWLDVVDR